MALGLAVPVVVAVLLGSCGGSGSSAAPSSSSGKAETRPVGDIPDTQAYVAYSPPSGPYTLKVPEGWARSDGLTGVTFTDNLNSIRVDVTPTAAPPDLNTVRTTGLPTLQASTPGFRLQDITTVTRPAGTAVLVRYLGDGPANAVTGKRVAQAVQRYEFWRNGVRVAITLVSPVGADNVDPWRKVTDSFAWVG
jgi:hypothetical protein